MFIGFDQHATSEHLLIPVIEQLCKAGHSVHVIQKDTGGELPHIPVELSEYPVTTTVIPFKAAQKGNFVARYLVELKYVKACKKHITSEFDAVFIQSNNVAGFAVREIRKKLPTVPVTFNVQDIFPNNASISNKIKGNSVIYKVLLGIQHYAYKNVNNIITISEDMKDTLVNDGVSKDKIIVIYNWSYQDDVYHDLDITPVADIFSKQYYNVVYAGNIGIMQNVDIIIEAASIMRNNDNIWFHIIGDGVYKGELEKRAKDYGVHNISFWPMQPPKYAPMIYCAADINIIPLVKGIYKTALPSKTATCLACQKPIIFAIGKDSKYGEKVMSATGCPVVEPDVPEELVQVINDIKSGEIICSTKGFFLKHCNRTNNTKEYVATICNATKKKEHVSNVVN